MSGRHARAWATGLVVVGYLVIAAGAVGAIAVLLVPASFWVVWPPAAEDVVGVKLAVAVGLLGVALAAGVSGIVMGLMLRVLLDQRRILARLARRLRRWEARLTPEPVAPRVVDRLRPRS